MNIPVEHDGNIDSKHILLIIDSPIYAYLGSLLERNTFDVIYAFDSKRFEFDHMVSACRAMLNMEVEKEYFLPDSIGWESKRNIIQKFKAHKNLRNAGFDIMKSQYDEVLLYPFTSVYAALISSKVKKYSALSHGSFDIFRFIDFRFSSIKIFAKTAILIHRPVKYYSLITLKKNPKWNIDLSYRRKTYAENRSEIKKNFPIDSCEVILLWSESGSSVDSYNQKYINLNFNLVKLFLEIIGESSLKSVLIKAHKSSKLPSDTEKSFIRNKFNKVFHNVTFFSDYNSSEILKYISVELVVDVLSPAYILGTSSSALWNCSNLGYIKSYGCYSYEIKERNFSNFGLRVYSKLKNDIRKPPISVCDNR